jgi:hypothetical protein
MRSSSYRNPGLAATYGKGTARASFLDLWPRSRGHTFIVTQDDQRTVYGPGQIFAVDHEHPHDESIGPEGARVLVGRKFKKA